MFIDASAIMAILNRESGYEQFVSRIEEASTPLYTSPLSRFEAAVSLARQRTSMNRKPSSNFINECAHLVDDFLSEIGTKDVHISSAIGNGALKAAATYGKAVGHEADLNFGDCFSYACAKAYRLKLMYKGNDFVKTALA